MRCEHNRTIVDGVSMSSRCVLVKAIHIWNLADFALARVLCVLLIWLKLLRTGHTKPRGGVDMGDHPPITPCRAMSPHEGGGNSGRIFEMIVRHF
eukprot:COSAG02_NODE_7071_length_3200_cov_1.462109_5_plen_94_part_01